MIKSSLIVGCVALTALASSAEEYFQAAPIKPFTAQQELVLTGLIYLEKHNLPSHAMAYFAQAIAADSKAKKLSMNTCWAKTHLARTQIEKGLRFAAAKGFQDVLKSCTFTDPEKKTEEQALQRMALQKLIEVAEDIDLVGFIEPWLTKYPDIGITDSFHLLRAKYSSGTGDLETSLREAQAVTDSKLKPQADLIASMILYRSGKLAESLDLLEKDREARLAALSPDLRSEAQMLIARLRFQKGDYQGAFQSYGSVPKGNPIWMQAMIEQAWAQILHKDYEGAAGNMYSLHTDFFKNAFAPESYIVRAVGYLNLCQFGDSVRTLYDLNRKYMGLRMALEKYESTHAKSAEYYSLVREFLLNSDLRTIQGLPKFAIYDLAKNRHFISVQTRINSLQDEMEKYVGISEDLINWEKKTHSKKATALRPTIKDLRLAGAADIKAEQIRLQGKAGEVLQERFKQMIGDIKKSVEQSELLRYEILSAAGENMRFQLAGGQISDQEKSYLELPKNQTFQWDFNGEVWEDELGHYRSNLKNICAQNDKNDTKTDIKEEKNEK